MWVVPSALDPATDARQHSGCERPEEEAVMPNPVDLEPQAKAVVDANANPPYLFELGPDQGRSTIDELQSGPVKKLTVDFEDTAVPGGPSGQVSVRALRSCWIGVLGVRADLPPLADQAKVRPNPLRGVTSELLARASEMADWVDQPLCRQVAARWQVAARCQREERVRNAGEVRKRRQVSARVATA